MTAVDLGFPQQRPDPAADPADGVARPASPAAAPADLAGAVAVAQPGREVVGSLSPSRAGDFMSCPLLFRFRTIDRLPQAPSAAATRGTVVHAVLERLFDLPAAERTVEAAAALLEPEWDRLREAEPAVEGLFGDEAALRAWLDSARSLLEGYFTLEDPQRLEPAKREEHVEVVLDSGLRLRGIVDRVDVAPNGAVRVVDYKTGRAPREAFERKALFQMRFYALVLWRTTGVVPTLLQLMYLGDREVLRYAPDERDLLATERTVLALWDAIEKATSARDFRPSTSGLCDWCDHQALCPAFGGTPPPWPETRPDTSTVAPSVTSSGDSPMVGAQVEPVVAPERVGPAAGPQIERGGAAAGPQIGRGGAAAGPQIGRGGTAAGSQIGRGGTAAGSPPDRDEGLPAA